MSFGKNLQFLRKLRNSMTQEDLAERLSVSRQTVSKWELDAAYPEINKIFELCDLFSCSMDHLLREEMDGCNEAYSNIRVEYIEGFQYIPYTVISLHPEEDAIRRMTELAVCHGEKQPQIIGWDFPFVSQEQVNIHHMHGYTAAWILPSNTAIQEGSVDIITQNGQKYAAITIKEPSKAPFMVIPEAYQTLMEYMKINQLKDVKEQGIIPCYEREYTTDGVHYMDVYIAIK